MQAHVVTGAFGYSGRYIAERLLERGFRVRTLTNHPDRSSPLFNRIETAPLSFENRDQLIETLRGAAVLYNTYWIRFERGEKTFDRAVENSQTLIRAAREAGVRRVVHVSITNPCEDSSLPYFRGKALVERALHESGLSYAILRPTVFFGGHDILLNNIAWLLRRFPVFAVFGDGQYKLQPVHVEDLAALAVEMGDRTDNITLDAVGPESFTYEELVRTLARHVGKRPRILHLPPPLGFLAGKVFGWLVRDVIVTRDEIEGLMNNLLVSSQPPPLAPPASPNGSNLMERRWGSVIIQSWQGIFAVNVSPQRIICQRRHVCGLINVIFRSADQVVQMNYCDLRKGFQVLVVGKKSVAV